MSTTERTEGHTPLPWDTTYIPRLGYFVETTKARHTGETRTVAQCGSGDESGENAMLIAFAVNSHAALEAQVAALTEALAELREAALEFVQKVDSGRARSIAIYGKFKAALPKADAALERAAATEEGGND